MISIHSDLKGHEFAFCAQTNFSTNATASSPHQSYSRSDLTGLEAGNDIPARSFIGTCATDFVLGRDLLNDKRQERESSSNVRRLKVYWRNGRPEVKEGAKMSSSCLQAMRSARDRHEQNVELVRRGAALLACTVRAVGRGEELLMWYGDGLAREVGVPILNPCHIRGHQEYVCNGCLAYFTYPNSLKAHMFLQCKASLFIPSSDEGSLIPFHHLLENLSQPPCGSDKHKKISGTLRDNRFSMTSSSALRLSCSGCCALDEESTHRSAFRTPTASRDIKREVSSDDRLMTPDSSTDQFSALNLSVKLSETSAIAEKEVPVHAIHSWNTSSAHHVMAQSFPFDCSPLAGCYPISHHLHALGIQYMKCRQSLHTAHPYDVSLERSLCNSGEYSPQMESAHDRAGISPFQPHTPPVLSSIRQTRQNSSYSFALPSDKEPLDLLPQAFFANKSKKGHLCLCCGKLYSRKYGLKIHMRTHNGYKPLKCKICSRPFGDPSNLNKHVRLHAQGETPYRCEFCGKVLVRRRDLERHMRSRHPVGCIQSDDTLGVCESSTDSSPVSIESSENPHTFKKPPYDNS